MSYGECEITNRLVFPPRQKMNTHDIILKESTPTNMSVANVRKMLHFESLPSPRTMHQLPEESDLLVEPPESLISISELNPFFEELDPCSDENSSDEESQENMGQDEISNETTVPERRQMKCKRTSSIRRIFSSVRGRSTASATKSQESVSSSSVQTDGSKSVPPGSGKETRSLRKKLKNVSNRVRRQFSSGFLADKFAAARASASNTGITEQSESEGREDCERDSRKKAADTPEIQHCPEQLPNVDAEETSVDTEERWGRDGGGDVTNRPIVHLDYVKDVNVSDDSNSLIWSLPSWVDSKTGHKTQTDILEELMEAEKRKIAQKQPMEWAEAVGYLRRSVGRDFRRGYLALGEKMLLPNMQAIRYLKFNPLHSFLAIGCEKGTLIVLELNYQKPLQNHAQLSKSEASLQDSLYSLPVGSKCRIQMNETLVGHTFDLRCLAWNSANGKLLSSDDLGVIIGWGFSEGGCWVEEFINDKSTSMIRDMALSPDGSKIAIAYEDCLENGSITCGVLVGYADGTQIFDRKFPHSQVNCVAWYSDEIVWTVVDCVLYTFDGKGELGKVYRPLSRSCEGVEITSLLLKPKTSWVTSENAPEFAVVFKDSCMTLFNNIEDKAPLRVPTKLVTTCADWCANGIYIAIGGVALVTGDTVSPRINLYNYEGNLLQIVKIPGKAISNICWDHDSMHLALSTGRSIYFANLRPMYKASSNGSVHCYAYTTDGSNQLVNFWNGKTQFTETIPAKVIDIKCCNDRFALLCMDSLGVYHVFVFGETGVHQQHLCITTMEPFAITMTKNCIVCLAPNAILNWNFNLVRNSPDYAKKFTGALKETRQVHVEDFPAIIAKPGERNNHLLKPASNCARCMHALRDQLCIARESGRLQLYALPTLGFLQTYQVNLSEGDICQQLSFNSDGTRLALLTMNGHLKIFIFPETSGGQGTDVIDCEGFMSISDLLWASDMTNFLCVLEGNDIHIIKDDIKVETISKVPPGSYLTKFEALEVSLLDMERVIANSENPSPSTILKIRTPTLARMKTDLGTGEPFEDILRILNSTCYNHTLLRRLVAEEALRQGEYTLAEHIYSYDQNYMAVQFLERIRDIESPELKKAEACCFLGEDEQAQHYFLRAGRKDLAIKMWRDLGYWEKVDFLSGSYSDDVNCEAVESQYEECVECEDWESAYELDLKSENAEEIMKTCIMLEDHEKLIDLSERLPARDPLLKKIGEVLACDGVIEEAAKCFVDYGDPTTAMKFTVDTRHWDLAMRLSHQYDLPLIIPSLVAHVKSLIAANNLNPAIQILERCGKIITAGKLLVWKGLCMLQKENGNTLEIKKVFVLAAQTLSKTRSRVKKSSVTSLTKTDSQELDLEFLIPEKQLRVMNGHNEWCWSDPWRGAEAIHFLNLCQRFIYRNMTGRAFKAAMHLRTFEDILGSDRINSMVALTAINEGCLRTASNALLKLEVVDESYSAISFNLFKDRPPQDRCVNRIQCPGCQKSIPDFLSVCPQCNTKLFMCIFSACPIMQETEMWTCQVCSRHVDITKRDRFSYCLLCHSEAK